MMISFYQLLPYSSIHTRENLSPGSGQRKLYFLLKQQVPKGFSNNISFLFLLLNTSFPRLFGISVLKILNAMAIRDRRVLLSNVQPM